MNVGSYRAEGRTTVFGFRQLILKFGGVLCIVQTTFVLVILQVKCINMRNQAFQEAISL